MHTATVGCGIEAIPRHTEKSARRQLLKDTRGTEVQDMVVLRHFSTGNHGHCGIIAFVRIKTGNTAVLQCWR